MCISFKNYLSFHTLIEVASVTSAFIISIIAINTYKISHTNNELKLKAQELEKSNEKLKSEIRERKIAENKLIISGKRYKNLVETLPDAIFVHVDGKITFVNDAAKILTIEDDNLEVAADRSSIDQLSVEFSDIYFDN